MEYQDTVLDIKSVRLGDYQTNCYALRSAGELFIVDPGDEFDKILELIDGESVRGIILTHWHMDHVGMAARLKEYSGAKVYASFIDAPEIQSGRLNESLGKVVDACEVDVFLQEGDIVKVGDISFDIILTPGHTTGSMCLFASGEQGGKGSSCSSLLISGDTLFCSTIGRVDMIGGSMEDMRNSLAKLSALPDDTLVLPGHEGPTSIGQERNRVFAQYL